MADGGYYDNFGVTVAVEWIKQIREEYSDRLGKIVVISIDAFPENNPEEKQEDRRQFAHFLNPQSGWGSEVLGPVKTVLNSRSAAQYGRDGIEFDLLKNDGGQAGPTGSGGKSTVAPLETPPECDGFVNVIPFVARQSGPLSWQLSDHDKDAIKTDWSSSETGSEVEVLKKCLDITK